MSCLDIQGLLVEYLLGDLDKENQAIVAHHLASGCSACNAELKLLSESVEVMWQAVPHSNLSEQLQSEIVARVCPKQPIQIVQLETPKTPPINRRHLIHNPIAQALVAFAAGVLFMMYFFDQTVSKSDSIAKRRLESQAVSGKGLSSAEIPNSLEMSEKRYESAQLVSLRKKTGSNELRGHVLWDSLTREIHIFCYGLQQPPQGTQYTLWLIGPGNVARVVERLNVDSNGVCKAAAHWPEGDFQYASVTLEPTSSLGSRPSENVELTSNAIQPSY